MRAAAPSLRELPLDVRRICGWVNRVFARSSFFPKERTGEQAAYVPLSATSREDPAAPAVFRIETPASRADQPVAEAEASRIAEFVALRGREGGSPARGLPGALPAPQVHAGVCAGPRAPWSPVRDRRRKSLRRLGRAGVSHAPAPGARRSRQPGTASGGPARPALRRGRRSALPVRARRWTLFFSTSLPRGTDPRITRAFEIFREGETLADTLPPAAAIARFVEKLGWVAAAAARDLGDSRAGNLLKALAAARKFSAEGFDFAGAVEELERLRAEDAIEEMGVEPGRPGAVRLMTIHSAKGLEAPVVFLADPTGGTPGPRDYCVDRQAEPPGATSASRGSSETSETRRLRGLRAGMRCRRPRSVSTKPRRSASSTSERRGPKRCSSSASRRAGPESHPGPGRLCIPSSNGSCRSLRALRGKPGRYRRDCRRSSSRPAASGLRAARSAPPPATRWPPSPPSRTLRRSGPSASSTGKGLSWGSAVHRLLEALMRDASLDLRAYAANVLSEEERPAEDLDEVVRLVEAVRSSPLWKRALAAKSRFVEVPFALTVPSADLGDAAGPGPADTLLTGALDLVFEEEDGWRIVDYKSDTIAGNLDDLVAFYKPQIAHYRRYWQQLTGRPTKAGLFFVSTGQEVWLEET